MFVSLNGSLGLPVLPQVGHGDRLQAPAAHNRTPGDRRPTPSVHAGLAALVDQGLDAALVIDVATVGIFHGSPHLLPADGTNGVHLHLK